MIPRMSQPESAAEFTLKAVVTGVVLGIVFGAANAYLGLRVGMTVSASIPAAVMTVATFRLLRRGGTILEANLSQTVASASTSLATGTIFTIPALFLWGLLRVTEALPAPRGGASWRPALTRRPAPSRSTPPPAGPAPGPSG